MSESPLSHKVMPRRRAARRASAAAAAQMRSSSDSEREEEPEWNPGKSKGARSGKRLEKGRSTGSILEPRLSVDEERRRSSPIKTYSVKRKRRAAALADDEDSTTSEGVATPSLAVVESISAPLPSRPKPRPRPRPKLKVSAPADRDTSGLGDGEESDLTPLSSPTDLREGAAPSATPAVPAVPSRPLRGHPMFTSAVLKAPEEKRPSTPKKSSRRAKEVEEGWELGQLGQHVWVRLDGKNSQTAGVFMRNSTSEETVWWPGLVLSIQSKPPLNVKLYGEPSRRVTIIEPCRENIRSRLVNKSFARFTCYEDALQCRHPNAGSSSPRKKGKFMDAQKAAWEKAKTMMHENAGTLLEADDLPPPFLVVSTSLRRTESQPSMDVKPAKAGKRKTAAKARQGKRKRAATEEADDILDVDDMEGFVDENNLGDLENLDPGDQCLARESRGNAYWPAKVLEYHPPSKRGEEAQYKVVYLDYKKATIPMSYVAAPGSVEFATCKLGTIASAVVDDTIDAEDEQDPSDLRDPSPPPRGLLPSKDDFMQLEIREQFAYVKPVLQAILRNEYRPTKAKFERFLANDKVFMSNLNKSSAMSGMIVPSDVFLLTSYLKWWALRGEVDTQRKDSVGVNEGDDDAVSVIAPESVATEPLPSIAPSSPYLSERTMSPGVEPPPSSLAPSGSLPATQSTVSEPDQQEESDRMDTREDGVDALISNSVLARQVGSLGYEALTAWQRLDFCLNILKQEAIRQILLWRSGERTSIDLLSEDEEQLLYEKGQELLEERDWVMDIIRLRKKEEAEHRTSNPLGLRGDQTVSKKGRTLTRKNYAESDSD